MTLEKFFGGSPGWVVFRLVLLSIVVGLVFSVIGLHPFELVDLVRNFILGLWERGWEAVEWLLGYFLLGAIVVVPIWMIMRFSSLSKKNSD